MMKCLAIETSTNFCSVALSIDGRNRVEEALAPRLHGELVLQSVDRLLKQQGLTGQQLDIIACGRGPGAFTGVRMAIGIVQGLAFAWNKKVMPVSSLACLAQQCCDENKSEQYVAVVQDARMGDVYWAVYALKDGAVTEVVKEALSKPEQLNFPEHSELLCVGSGIGLLNKIMLDGYSGKLTMNDQLCYPSADSVLTLAQSQFDGGAQPIDAMALEPTYLRNNVAKKPQNKKKRSN
jgi:tRNA threonylcarbamoyladenosine biosynthesis protein TsaB